VTRKKSAYADYCPTCGREVHVVPRGPHFVSRIHCGVDGYVSDCPGSGTPVSTVRRPVPPPGEGKKAKRRARAKNRGKVAKTWNDNNGRDIEFFGPSCGLPSLGKKRP
jgi:hypothetical protein